jgi:hypothetical protein
MLTALEVATVLASFHIPLSHLPLFHGLKSSTAEPFAIGYGKKL